MSRRPPAKAGMNFALALLQHSPTLQPEKSR
jgi:hypothetical protein